MNIFRILADLSHTASKCILIWAIHSNKSAEGVSLVTQFLYFIVFITRYLDLFWVKPWWHWWNFILKNFYIWSSLYIIFIMTRMFARTRERERSWRFAAYIMAGCMIAAPICSLVFEWSSTNFVEILHNFSLILESVCVLPQLLLLRQTTVPTVIDSYYLVTLGSYRALYIVNWIYRGLTHDPPDPISVIFGVIQTAFYVDFAWVYWTRQRVKLRGGAVVDSDDLRKGFLVNRFSDARPSVEEETEAGEANGSAEVNRPTTNRWGVRGVSIKADDALEEQESFIKSGVNAAHANTAPLKDPNQFLDDDDEEDDDAPALEVPEAEVLNSNHEWRDNSS